MVLGLMSGTSMDGVDACLTQITLSPRRFGFKVQDTVTVPFAADEKEAIVRSLTGSADEVATQHFHLGEIYARVATDFLRGRRVDLVGLHGQTVAHRDGSYSLQVGTPAYLCHALRVPVVTGFRDADVAAGGNGAPLMPFLDWLLSHSKVWPLKDNSRSRAAVVLNLGGIANVSAVSPDTGRSEVVGFDTGPGMGLIDEAAQLLFDSPSDNDGRYSAAGIIRDEVLSELMEHPFICRHPPKSTGRDEFGGELVRQLVKRFTVPPADLLRSLVRFTARSIVESVSRFINLDGAITTLIASGGGVHHPLLMADLAEELPGWSVNTSQILGIDPDFKEALLMAVLAAARVKGIPGNMSGVTGAREQVVLGQVTV